MSHTNSTTNYSLPQFVTSDKPAWLTDVNNAYTAIDTGMYNAQTKANTADTNASQALLDASAAATAASTADAKGGGAVASLADTFQTTETYEVGDLVMYNNLLYVCSTAVTDPGAWTGSTNWSRVTVEGFVNNKTASNIPLNSSVGAPMTEAVVSGTESIAFTASAALSTNNCQIFRTGLWVVVAIEIVLSSDQTGWYDFITTTPDVSLPEGIPFFGVVCTDSEGVMPKYCQAYQNGSKMSIRIRNAKANQQYRGQIVFPLASI